MKVEDKSEKSSIKEDSDGRKSAPAAHELRRRAPCDPNLVLRLTITSLLSPRFPHSDREKHSSTHACIYGTLHTQYRN